MRGKRSGPRGAGRVPASTPAYAGQTGRQWCGGCGGGLYPRICGANPIRLDFPGNKPPLPPHMRGKRGCRSCCGGRMASTPAYAGQTRPVHPGEGSLRLYPRICGANLVPLLCVDVDEPLPPHMRGKLSDTVAKAEDDASTPAYAGQTLVEPRNSAEAYSPITRFSFTASPPASSGTRHTPSKTTGPATTSSKTTVR